MADALAGQGVSEIRVPPLPPAVLVTHDWAGGFCPLHWPEPRSCFSGCFTVRHQFYVAAMDLERYWRVAGCR